MRRLAFAVMIALVASLATALSACTLFDDDPPPANSCAADTDCFRAQGEHCNVAKHVCEVRSDAGVDAP